MDALVTMRQVAVLSREIQHSITSQDPSISKSDLFHVVNFLRLFSKLKCIQ